jgi:hypothetical protein
MKKKIEPICKNCRLYNPARGLCSVVILHEGERVNIPVDPNDQCFFEQQYFDPTTGSFEDFNEVKEVKFWVENDKGQKTNKDGVVKIEYPEGFFGDKTVRDILG